MADIYHSFKSTGLAEADNHILKGEMFTITLSGM